MTKELTGGIYAQEFVQYDADGNIVSPGVSVGPNVSVATAISGVITVTTAGTAVQGPNVALTNGAYVRALSTNTGIVYLGNDGAGDVSSSNGYGLTAGQAVIVQVANLNELWFDSAVNGEKFCWLKA
jgi:hypothetical protein